MFSIKLGRNLLLKLMEKNLNLLYVKIKFHWNLTLNLAQNSLL